MRLIGAGCKRGDTFSQCILIGRGLFLLLHVVLPHFITLYLVSRVGAYCDEVTPVPIPNTAVKLICVDDPRLVTARKSRSVPAQLSSIQEDGAFLLYMYNRLIEVLQ